MKMTERLDAITSIPVREAEQPPPKSVKIELTGKCNLECAYCTKKRRARGIGEMDQDFYRKLIDDLAKLGVEEVGLFLLGESFLVDWLPQAIQYAKQKGIPYTFLTTNATILKSDRIKDVMNAGLDSLKFSMNYPDEETFQKITGARKDFFRRAIDNVKMVGRLKKRRGWTCLLTASYIQYNGEQAKKMQAVLDEIRPWVDGVYPLPLYNQAVLEENIDQYTGWAPTAGNLGRADNPRDPLPCWSLFAAHVAWDGQLVACCFDNDQGFNMGDLNKKEFMKCWNSSKFKKLRQAHLDLDISGTACEKCLMCEI